MKNHIFLIMAFAEELRDLAMAQGWINDARKTAPTNRELKEILDSKQEEISLKQDRIHDEMFEICRSN